MNAKKYFILEEAWKEKARLVATVGVDVSLGKLSAFIPKFKTSQTALIRYFGHLAPFLNMQIKSIGSARQSNLCQ